MAAPETHQRATFSISKSSCENCKRIAVLAVCVALTLVPTTPVLGQFSQQQQEQQQREQQQRDQQQREQQQREQQEREQQQRDQQQREQQEREQRERDQQQREQAERQRELPNTFSTGTSSTSRAVQSSESDVHRPTSFPKASQVEGKANASAPVAKTVAKDNESRPPNPARDGRLCADGPCKEAEPKPITFDLHSRICKDGPCPACPTGQARTKDGSCVAAAATKVVANPAAAKPGTATQLCPAGQIWNGFQCALAGTQRCMPGQTLVGAMCQVDCTSPTAGAQNLIMELRNARQKKDEACRQDPSSQECQIAEAHYSLTFTEYQGYLAGVPAQCGLPDPIAI